MHRIVVLVCFHEMELKIMKRIALLVCGMLLLVANTAEARRYRWSNNQTYARPPVAHTTHYAPAAYAAPVTPSTTAAADDTEATASAEANNATSSEVTTAAATNSTAATVRTV